MTLYFNVLTGGWEPDRTRHKGGSSKQQMKLADQLSQQRNQQAAANFAQQQAIMGGMVTPQLQQIIANQGMLPQTEAAMRTQALQGLGQQYSGLEGQLGQQLAARGLTGGNMAGGGDIARQFGSLFTTEAGQQSNLLNQIQLAKAQGLQGALGLGTGIGGMYGQQGTSLAGQGVSALGVGQQAASAADQAQTGFWGSLFGALGGMGSAALGPH
jgi:hypothetical protein